MGFIIIKGQEQKGAHQNQSTLYNGLLYCATSLASITIFNNREEAMSAIKKSKLKWPEMKFKIVTEEEMVPPIDKTKKKVDDMFKTVATMPSQGEPF